MYRTGTIEHRASAWFKQPNTFSDISAIRDEAIAFADAIMEMCLDTCEAHDWAIFDPTGTTLYTEPFSGSHVGQKETAAERTPAESISLSSIGKGVPPSIGLGFGNTRTFIFPGFYWPAVWNTTKLLPTMSDYESNLRDFLDNSLIVGADRYGQGAEFGVNYNIQANAHFQKRYGI
jgi:hypothetical protein